MAPRRDSEDVTESLASRRPGDSCVAGRPRERAHATAPGIAIPQLRAGRPGHGSQPTARVDEACLRLVRLVGQGRIDWRDRARLARRFARIRRRAAPGGPPS